ncbi:hypothetical protein [Kordia sp.]|uniref:hypothetical protein n=1 Tax=Kordia sp. TaxID=1965332 RepID=UPI0025C28747|nr:hypothetical protein [Kordia sp.]MCH2192596.1 hypothetical protein [Kordia sp.]
MEPKFITVTDKQDVVHVISVNQIAKITDLPSGRAISLSDNSEITTLTSRAQLIRLINNWREVIFSCVKNNKQKKRPNLVAFC